MGDRKQKNCHFRDVKSRLEMLSRERREINENI